MLIDLYYYTYSHIHRRLLYIVTNIKHIQIFVNTLAWFIPTQHTHSPTHVYNVYI